VIINIKYSDYLMNDYDIDKCRIDASKHFILKYMKRWNWDFNDLRDEIKNSYKIEKLGKRKYEAYIKDRVKKIIFVYYKEFDTIFVISGSEGS